MHKETTKPLKFCVAKNTNTKPATLKRLFTEKAKKKRKQKLKSQK